MGCSCSKLFTVPDLYALPSSFTTAKTLPGRHCPCPEQPFNKAQAVGVVVGLTEVVVELTRVVVGLTGVVVVITRVVVGLIGVIEVT